MILVAGAAGTGSAPGAGTLVAAGCGGKLISYLSRTSAHQFFHLVLAAMGTLHRGVSPEDQLLKILVTAIAVKLKNGHLSNISLRALILVANILYAPHPLLPSKRVGAWRQKGALTS
jgi:hypothetical protein